MLCERLRDDKKYNILDLGDARGPNVEFFRRYPCRIYVEALYESLREFDTDIEDLSISKLLSHPHDIKFDLVLCWDLFDYLESDVIEKLMTHMSGFCKPGTLMFMLTSTRADIPARPAKFTIADEQFVLYEPQTVEVINNPARTALGFEKLMTGFRLLHSFMLRNGMQEYVFIAS